MHTAPHPTAYALPPTAQRARRCAAHACSHYAHRLLLSLQHAAAAAAHATSSYRPTAHPCRARCCGSLAPPPLPPAWPPPASPHLPTCATQRASLPGATRTAALRGHTPRAPLFSSHTLHAHSPLLSRLRATLRLYTTTALLPPACLHTACCYRHCTAHRTCAHCHYAPPACRPPPASHLLLSPPLISSCISCGS